MLVVHYRADLQSMHGFRCYDNIAPNAKYQQVLVLAICLVSYNCVAIKYFRVMIDGSLTCSDHSDSICYKFSAVAEMGDRLVTIDMSRKLGGCAPFGREELGPHVTQCGLGRGLPSYQVAS